MRNLKQKLVSLAVLAFIVGMLAIFIAPTYRESEPSLNGRPAKDFQFVLDGKTEHLSDLRGHVVVLNFWATWCPPCVDEAPALNDLQKHVERFGGTVLGISVDDDNAAYTQFLKDHDIVFPTYRDATKKIPLSYGTVMYPETYIIDANGKVQRKIIGPQEWTSPEMISYLSSLAHPGATTQVSSLIH
jgi:cytochrome c biogenesis protein CcmG, thiol:disulfide interchange protein DsbE